MGSYTRLQVRRVVKGNGNACAFIFPDQTIGIVDWGTDDRSCIRSLLDDEKPPKVRFVLATHSHADHTMGLLDVLEECVNRGVRPENFFYPAIGQLTLRPSDYLGRAVKYAVDHHIPTHSVSVHDFDPKNPAPPFAIAANPDWDVSILAPPSSSNNRHQIKSHLSNINPGNPTSIVLLFRYVATKATQGRAVLPGDATPAVLKFAADHATRYPDFHIDNDVMIAPHHGSSHNWPKWLTAHVQGVAVISAGANRPSHPSLSVLQLLGPHCRQTTPSSLFCTSYAHQCRTAFAHLASNTTLVREGPCFGDIEIELAPTGAQVTDHDPNGPARRASGYCTQ